MENSADQVPKTRRQNEIDRLRELYEKRPAEDDGFDFQGVLLSDAIERCVKAFDLIKPFDPNNLKAACYKLTIGDEYAVGGKIGHLSDEAGKNEIKILPFEVAIIKTHETINMPRFLIGRWNIQVSRAYKGLIWVGGPQVDAGYVGHLFCPIYNLSDQEVSLVKGQPISVIDFVPTTRFHEGQSKSYPFPPDRILFEEYEPDKLVSGLVSQSRNRLEKVENQIQSVSGSTNTQLNTIQQRVDYFIVITFTVIAVLFAAISVSAVGRQSPPWQYISLFLLSFFAIFLAASAWLNSKSEARSIGRPMQIIVLLGLGAAFVLQSFLIRDQRRQINQINKDIQALRSEQRNPAPAPSSTNPGQPRADRPSAAGKEPSISK
jgi:deoxycytidine triphosphate deaminase